MKPLTSSHHSDAIDPRSIRPGDKVEVCFCDTSASCVWSYPATARREGRKVWLIADDKDNVNHLKTDPLQGDGCYTYIAKRWKRG